MTITYTLSEADYVTYQLFTASTSPAIQKKRRKVWLLITAAFVMLALLFYDTGSMFLAAMFLLYGLFTLVFYPLFARRQYLKYYQDLVRHTFYQVVNKPVQCTFSDDRLELSDELSKSTIQYRALTAIQHIPGYYYLIVRGCQYLILPKAQLADEAGVKNALTMAAAQAGIVIQQIPAWKWH